MLPWLENFNRTASMHIGLVLYEDNPNNRVTIPNRLFEYMISGLAVVGEEFTEVKKVISDANCGYTCNSAEPHDIAKAVIATIEDNRGVLQLGINGKNAILQKYAFEYDLERLIDFYKQLLAK
jgi:glycosyltransferase involved in cell wall biosynthesis